MRRAWVLLPLLMGGCGAGNENSGARGGAPILLMAPSSSYALDLKVVDESGAALSTARVERDGLDFAVGSDGRLRFAGFDEPATLVVRAPGFLDEPVVLGPDDAGPEHEIRLRARSAGGVPRVAVHFGGDVMLGRRYVDPLHADTHVVVSGDGGISARAAVSSLAPLFGAADLRLANIETVIGTFPDSAAYPGKRYLLRSVPETVDALRELKLDVATLANNHVRDWLDAGLAATMDALHAGGISTVGAGMSEDEAAEPRIVDVGGLRIGLLAYSSIRGDYVNDSYPEEVEPAPPGGDPKFAFRYESRVWGFSEGSIHIPVASRRIRSAWRAIEEAEAELPGRAARAALWASAITVYPELQDWVARRGHGGANSTSGKRMPGEIQALREAGCDLVFVMMHNGHEFMESPALGAVRDAREAVDAGADAVVIHHAHVLQGFEIYRGKLICMGLGNCVFDQDFMATFLSGVLRVVFEGDRMLEARFLPMTLLRYRPAPLVGRMAERTLRMALERSAVEAQTDFYGVLARAALTPRPPEAVAPAFRIERNAATISPWDGTTATLGVVAGYEQPADLPGRGLVRSRAPGGGALPGVLFGRDLLRWGSFEDDAADGVAAGGPQWRTTDTPSSAMTVDPTAPSGERVLHLARGASNTQRVRLRPVALLPTPVYRFWTQTGPETVTPAEGPASYSLRFFARKSGGGATRFTLDAYNFTTTFGAGPETTFLRAVELSFDVPADDAWHEVLLDIPAGVFAPFAGMEVNAVMLYVGLHPPASGVTELRMDDLRLLEWRSPDLSPDAFFEVLSVRATTPGAVTALTLERRPE